MSTYSEKLKDPRWQKKRLEVLNRDFFMCQRCGDTESELHVHHLSYVKGAEPWEYDLNNFQTLCYACHQVAEICKSLKVSVITLVGCYSEKMFCACNDQDGKRLVAIFALDAGSKTVVLQTVLSSDDLTYISEVTTHSNLWDNPKTQFHISSDKEGLSE